MLLSHSFQDDAPVRYPFAQVCSVMDHRIRFSLEHFLRPGIHLRLHPGIAPCQIQLDVFDLSSFFSHTSALSIGKCSEFLFANDHTVAQKYGDSVISILNSGKMISIRITV